MGKAEKSQVILVLGMHRSGTSLVAQLINGAGAYFGDKLMLPNYANIEGFWEDLRLVELNDQILLEIDSKWMSPPELDYDQYLPVLNKKFQARAIDLISEMDKEGKVWCWKDPRFPVLLKFWEPLLCDRDLICIVPVRNPVEIAHSLLSRDDIPVTASFLIWERTYLELLKFTNRNKKTIFIDYDRLVSDSFNQVNIFAERLSMMTELELSEEKLEIMHAAVKPDLRHHICSLDQSVMTLSQINLQKYLKELCLGGKTKEIKPKIYLGWKEYLNSIKFKERYKEFIAQVDDKNLELKTLTESNNQLNATNEKLEEKNNQLNATNEKLEEKNNQLGGINSALVQQKTRITKEKEELNNKLELLYKTKLWKIAKFLQGIVELLTRLIHPFKTWRLLKTAFVIRDSGLWDRSYYFKTYPHYLLVKYFAVIHYLFFGTKEGRNPNPLFDTGYYLEENPDVAQTGINPLHHYIKYGAKEGRNPNPLFDTVYYLEENPDVAQTGINPLYHFIEYGAKEGRNPNPLFDTVYYLEENPDVAQTGINPLYHFIEYGVKEGRNPNPLFDIEFYLHSNREAKASGLNPLSYFILNGMNGNREFSRVFSGINYYKANPDIAQKQINPLEHYLRYGIKEKRPLFPRIKEKGCYECEKFYRFDNCDIKLLAFYLPQFHPIPENDEWWGKGFTEWTNVTKARPLFNGHYQPRLPGEFGFYDLRLVDVMKRQVELAKQYGIHGFCFHHYWFSGKRLLETPVDNLLKHPEINLPFCLCWANENWSRGWDGSEEEILIAQNHSSEDDVAFIKDIEKYFRDSRYIRVAGKLLLVVYRASILPEPRATVERWREHCRKADLGELYLVAVQSFGITDPHTYGFDAAVEFPPHTYGFDAAVEFPPHTYGFDAGVEFSPHQPSFLKTLHIEDIVDNFTGRIRDYNTLADIYINKEKSDYLCFKTVSPSWDNTSRRNKRALLYTGSTPDNYQRWLLEACRFTVKNYKKEERFVFVNAWNEWAEAAYLEPDRKYGYAFLNKTAEVLKQFSRNK
ncbi:MAG: glycoside hydrolase family 99-like domain-containing protein [Candidatus Theseobacter exili]|nr:glycoside hydrolase family 99-like domain-containing protein [Candidatus Theseobacter exili]